MLHKINSRQILAAIVRLLAIPEKYPVENGPLYLKELKSTPAKSIPAKSSLYCAITWLTSEGFSKDTMKNFKKIWND